MVGLIHGGGFLLHISRLSPVAMCIDCVDHCGLPGLLVNANVRSILCMVHYDR